MIFFVNQLSAKPHPAVKSSPAVGSSKDASGGSLPENVLNADASENRECFYCHELGYLIESLPPAPF